MPKATSFARQGNLVLCPQGNDVCGKPQNEVGAGRRTMFPRRTAWKTMLCPADTNTAKRTSLRMSFLLVPLTGIEPVRCCQRGILSPLRLPVPPQRRMRNHPFIIVDFSRSVKFEFVHIRTRFCPQYRRICFELGIAFSERNRYNKNVTKAEEGRGPR